LYTQGTPNGFKPSIYLEELIETYGAEKVGYDYSTLSFQEADQKKPEFLKINPNGRIPALVDENFKDPVTGGGHGVFESASILLWLAEKYDSESKFWFEDPLLRSKALSWIFFAHGGVGPMQGELTFLHGTHGEECLKKKEEAMGEVAQAEAERWEEEPSRVDPCSCTQTDPQARQTTSSATPRRRSSTVSRDIKMRPDVSTPSLRMD